MNAVDRGAVVRPTVWQQNAARFASTPAPQIDQERHSGVRAAVEQLRAGRPGYALFKLARSVERQYRHNRAITCGKQPGHLNVDPLHKMDPTDQASCEWFDYDTAHAPEGVVDLLGALQRAVDTARAARRAEPGERP